MLGMEQNNDDLQAAFCGNKVFIRVIGRGSFRVASTLKQFITEECNKESIQVIVLDLAECIGMDSTFMGITAGLSGRLKKKGQRLELINLSDKNANLLATLGIDQVLAFYGNEHGHELPSDPCNSLVTNPSSDKEVAETALQAHEKLVDLNEENLPKFERVIEMLKRDVDRLN